MEDKHVTISRAQGSLTFPANFQRGFFGSPVKTYTCSHQTVTRYQKRISGRCSTELTSTSKCPAPAPEAERSGVGFEKLSDNRRGEASVEIRVRAEVARQHQQARFAGLNNGVMTNADMRVTEVRQFFELDDAGQMLTKVAMTQLQLFVRAYHRILKL
ncbi:MAG: ATP-binding protein [Anaerolineae bacterium]|nr:ATP-binding protein [Anaerolineae bacterium]MBT7990539.1 ATP-binding protein [Anaerolineae bacterium]